MSLVVCFLKGWKNSDLENLFSEIIAENFLSLENSVARKYRKLKVPQIDIIRKDACHDTSNFPK